MWSHFEVMRFKLTAVGKIFGSFSRQTFRDEGEKFSKVCFKA